MTMIDATLSKLLVLTGLLALIASGARAWDDAKYPDWKGQWERIGGGQYDPAKPGGRGQKPPLVPEYAAIWEAHLAEEASGGQNYNPMAHCIPTGMPRMMTVYQPMEIIITPDITYIPIAFLRERRRVYTDGRPWPASIKPSYSGFSLGRWIDTDGDGRFDTLEIETRGMKGPRLFEGTGIPLHRDNETVVKERLYLDRAKPDILHDEITVFDHALTEPWTVIKNYSRNVHPIWLEDVCELANNYVFLGKDTFFLSTDGYLMPTRKDQPPPDLRKFQ